MHNLMIVLFFILFVAVVVFLIMQSIKRRKAWQQFAASHGLTYSIFDLQGIPDRYYDFQLFKEGHSKKAYNICTGKEKDLEICAFDYQYVTGSDKEQQTHTFTCIVVASPLIFKHLNIRPENILD